MASFVESRQRDSVEMLDVGERVADGGCRLLGRCSRGDGEQGVHHRGSLPQLVVEQREPRRLAAEMGGETRDQFLWIDGLQEVVGGAGTQTGSRPRQSVVAGDEE